MSRRRRVKYDQIPDDAKASMMGLSPSVAEDIYAKNLEKNGIEIPEAVEKTSPVESPNHETNTAVSEEPVVEEENTTPVQQEDDITAGQEDEPVIEEQKTSAPIAESTTAIVPPVKKGNLDIALHEEREKNKILKKERDEERSAWEQKLSTINEQLEQLKKQGMFGVVPIQQPLQQQQVIPEQPFIAPPLPVQQPTHDNFRGLPQNTTQTTAQPTQENPAIQFWQEVTKQAKDQFVAITGREPRENMFEDEQGVIQDSRLLNALQTDAQLKVNRKIQEETEKKRYENERVQSTVQSFKKWEETEETQPDISELQQYTMAQLQTLPKDQQEIITQSYGRLRQPERFGNPSPTDPMIVQNFWQLCRAHLGHKKILDSQQRQPEPLEQVDSFVPEQEPVIDNTAAVTAVQTKLNNVANLPRTNFVNTAGNTSANTWTREKVFKAARNGQWDKLPKDHYEYIITNGVRGKLPSR